MHVTDCPTAVLKRSGVSAFTLMEVVIAMVIIATVLGAMTVAYTQATRRAQWTGYQLAAQALAVQSIEQARSAVWDQSLKLNQITNLNLSGTTFPAGGMQGYNWANLDLPISGSNYIRATNYITVSMLYLNGTTNPPVQVQMIKVQTVWPFFWGNTNRYYTNSIATYCAPDNRDPSSL